MYDVAIVGAGPAGSSLASQIGSKYKVILIDRREPEEKSGHFERVNAVEVYWRLMLRRFLQAQG